MTAIQVRAWERGAEAAKLVDPTRPRYRCHTVVAGGRDVRTGFSTPMAAWRWCEKNYSKEEIERLHVEVRGDTKIPSGVPYRTPDWAECDYISDRDMIEGLQELIDELSKPNREKIVGLLHARSRHLASQ